jgi:hypothetical protein
MIQFAAPRAAKPCPGATAAGSLPDHAGGAAAGADARLAGGGASVLQEDAHFFVENYVARLSSQDFLHRSPLGEFVDQFVQIADFPHDGFLHVFYADAADHSCYQGP